METIEGKWMTSPEFWKAAGFATRNVWQYFLARHPELEALRQRVGPAWMWPVAEIPRIRQLHEEIQKDRWESV